jgi:outer membrane protein assembly factor BamA
MAQGKQSLSAVPEIGPSGTSLAPLSSLEISGYTAPRIHSHFYSSVLITLIGNLSKPQASATISRLSCLALRLAGLVGIALLSICSLSGIAMAQKTGRPITPTTDAGMLIDSGLIVDVRFEGNENLTDYELRQVIGTQAAKGLKKFLYSIIPSLGTPPQFADRVVLDQDVENLELFYRDNGFMEADVEYEQRFDSIDYKNYIEILNKNRVITRESRQKLPRVRDTIVFWISEGPEYKISGVAFIGLESLPEEFQPELTERNTIKLGERFSAATVNSELVRLQSVLEENGYPFFKLDSVLTEVLPETKRVRILPYINPGNRYRFGDVRIEWDTTSREKSRVSDRVVLGQLSLDSGAWYKESEMRESEQYLQRLNVFESVHINLDTSIVQNIPQHMRDSMALPIVVRLRMRLAREVTPSVYAGYGGRVGFAAGASASYTDRNVFGGAQRFDADVFWQPIPSTQQRRSAGLSLLIPYLGVRNLPLNISSNYVLTEQYFRDRFVEDGSNQLEYRDENLRLRLNSTIVIGEPEDRSSVSPEVTAEYVNFYHLFQVDSTKNGIPVQISLNENLQKDTIRTNQQINTIVAGYGIWDQSNDVFNPAHGFILNGGTEFALPLLITFAPNDKFASASYWKSIVQGRIYDDLGTIGALIFASRVRFGYTMLFDAENPQRDPPLERRFFGGGSSSNRGWNAQQLLISNIPNRHTFEGGYNMLEGSVEFRIAPWKFDVSSDDPETFLNPLRLAVFADAGNVWDHTSIKQMAINQIAFTVGAGIRYNFFLGTFRVDFGVKMYDPNPTWPVTELAARTDTKGAWIYQRNLWDNSDWWALHFGLNQAF